MLKIVFFILFFVLSVQANDYRYTETIELAKDEYKKFFVKYDETQKMFKFRWTLYTNGTLVVLRSYDRIVAQNLLATRPKRRSFRVDLKPKGAGYGNAPYILVKFIEYDFNTNKAVFKLFLSDRDLKVSLEHLENE
ncbi:MAG: hypothetical protein H8E76_05885 [Helicobacteraceae bacterium]|nr:hypothetical protein [Candidatus Sulfurimonas ponti]MBL6973572.1 hypothetical protein [Sulfurimonas sp.]